MNEPLQHVGGRVWQDEHQPSAEWAAPRTHIPWGVKWAWTGLVVALVVGLVAMAGGLKPAGGRLTNVAPGTVIKTANYAFAMDRGFATKLYSGGWTIELIGTCQLTSEASDTSAQFAIDNLTSFVDPQTRIFDDGLISFNFDLLGRRDDLTPHQPPTPCSLRGSMPPDYEPRSHILLYVADSVWRDTSRVQDGSFEWAPTANAWTVEVPIEILPES